MSDSTETIKKPVPELGYTAVRSNFHEINPTHGSEVGQPEFYAEFSRMVTNQKKRFEIEKSVKVRNAGAARSVTSIAAFTDHYLGSTGTSKAPRTSTSRESLLPNDEG